MKKQFDLEYYLEHPETKVVTRRGYPARIICTDAVSNEIPRFNIVCLVLSDGYEAIYRYKSDGTFLEEREYWLDLFFDMPDPEKRKVPLTYEDLLERTRAGKTMWVHVSTYAKLIIGFNSNSISVVNGIKTEPRVAKFNYSELMGYNFIDGDPCWKEVGENE